MKRLTKYISTIAAAAGIVVAASTGAQAAVFSSTKAELLHGKNYPRGPGFSDINETILTLANATGFSKGDSYFFVDLTGMNSADATGGAHLEWSVRGSVPRIFGSGQYDGFLYFTNKGKSVKLITFCCSFRSVTKQKCI